LHCFEGVTAVIFVAAISEFDQQLYEDEKVNRLHESLGVFENIMNNPYFGRSTMILFMNKIDLLSAKLNNVNLGVCFNEYEGNNSFEDVCEYIKQKFMELNANPNHLIFSHLTCATDTSNVQKVFEACKITILSNNLVKIGLINN